MRERDTVLLRRNQRRCHDVEVIELLGSARTLIISEAGDAGLGVAGSPPQNSDHG